MIKIGLRVDADTFSGTRDGIPFLLRLFAKHSIRASFFFSLGPDNMGRHLWRLFRPGFLGKMLRSGAPSLYGWKMLLAGTAWPGKKIGRALGHLMRMTAESGHEVGLHAWDHRAWQAKMPAWTEQKLEGEIRLGLDALEEILGRPVDCSAAPGWRADQRVLEVKENFAFRYNSDSRGSFPFRPLLNDGTAGTPQIPVSLPTFDEVIGLETDEQGYNAYILNLFRRHAGVPVYTVHAEVEGISRTAMFEELLDLAKSGGMSFCPLSELLPQNPDELPTGKIEFQNYPGREGRLAVQR